MSEASSIRLVASFGLGVFAARGRHLTADGRSAHCWCSA